MAAVEPLLDENGSYVKGLEAKTLVNELQAECKSCAHFSLTCLKPYLTLPLVAAHEANDYLRERLTSISGDLCLAKERVYELENKLFGEEQARQRCINDLTACGELSRNFHLLRKPIHAPGQQLRSLSSMID